MGGLFIQPVGRGSQPALQGWGGGGGAMRSARLCVPLSLFLSETPPLTQVCPAGWEKPANPESRLKRARNCEGSGLGEEPTTASHRRVMGVEKDPEGKGAGEAGGRRSQPGQTKLSELRGALQRARRDVEGPLGLWGLQSVFRRLVKRTSAELSFVQPPQLAFVFFGIGRDALTKMSV